MGRRGPKPKPTRLKLAAGNPGKRKLPEHEPEPTAGPGIPKAPKGMTRRGGVHWRRLARDLWPLGLLTVIDHDALRMLCEALGEAERLENVIKRKGIGVETSSGRIVPGVEAQALRAAHERALRLFDRFGMNPSARSALDVDPPAAPDPFQSFLDEPA